jgi:hypothetical protein
VRAQLQQQGIYCNPLSVSQPEAGEIKFYPNPAASQLNIEFAQSVDDGTRIEVFSSEGRSCGIYFPVQGSTLFQMPMQELATGLYLIRITNSAGEISTQRIVHQ